METIIAVVVGVISILFFAFKKVEMTAEQNFKTKNLEDEIENIENYKKRQIERDSVSFDAKRKFLRNHRLGKK